MNTRTLVWHLPVCVHKFLMPQRPDIAGQEHCTQLVDQAKVGCIIRSRTRGIEILKKYSVNLITQRWGTFGSPHA